MVFLSFFFFFFPWFINSLRKPVGATQEKYILCGGRQIHVHVYYVADGRYDIFLTWHQRTSVFYSFIFILFIDLFIYVVLLCFCFIFVILQSLYIVQVILISVSFQKVLYILEMLCEWPSIAVNSISLKQNQKTKQNKTKKPSVSKAVVFNSTFRYIDGSLSGFKVWKILLGKWII
jgi:hypothetical protein